MSFSNVFYHYHVPLIYVPFTVMVTLTLLYLIQLLADKYFHITQNSLQTKKVLGIKISNFWNNLPPRTNFMSCHSVNRWQDLIHTFKVLSIWSFFTYLWDAPLPPPLHLLLPLYLLYQLSSLCSLFHYPMTHKFIQNHCSPLDPHIDDCSYCVIRKSERGLFLCLAEQKFAWDVGQPQCLHCLNLYLIISFTHLLTNITCLISIWITWKNQCCSRAKSQRCSIFWSKLTSLQSCWRSTMVFFKYILPPFPPVAYRIIQDINLLVLLCAVWEYF